MYALQSFSTISSLQVKNWCCLKTKNLFGMHMLFIIQVSGSESSYQINPNLHLKGRDAMKNGIRLVNHLNSIFNWKWHKMYLVVFNFEGDVSNTCQKKCWDRSKGPIADNMTVSLSEGATVRHLQLCDRRQVIQVNKLFLRITEIFRNFIFFPSGTKYHQKYSENPKTCLHPREAAKNPERSLSSSRRVTLD